MTKIQQIISLLLLVLLTAGCSTLAPEPTPTALHTATETLVPSPTSTQTPLPSLTPTLTPTQKPTIDPIEELMPVGEPAAEWQGIPIMPEAVAGEDDASGYRFAIAATSFEIEAYYNQEMVRLGWEPFATGTNDAGEVVMIMYSKGSETTSLMLIKGPDNLMIVLILQ